MSDSGRDCVSDDVEETTNLERNDASETEQKDGSIVVGDDSTSQNADTAEDRVCSDSTSPNCEVSGSQLTGNFLGLPPPPTALAAAGASCAGQMQANTRPDLVWGSIFGPNAAMAAAAAAMYLDLLHPRTQLIWKQFQQQQHQLMMRNQQLAASDITSSASAKHGENDSAINFSSFISFITCILYGVICCFNE